MKVESVKMAILGIVIGVLALLAAGWGVYYSRGQLREAKRVREENRRFTEQQQTEDDFWAEKYVKAGKLLCKIAEMDKLNMFVPGRRIFYPGGSLGMLFGEDVPKHILGQLIQEQNDNTYALRPIDVPQLRLKATRDLIDLVLARLDRLRREKPADAKELGLTDASAHNSHEHKRYAKQFLAPIYQWMRSMAWPNIKPVCISASFWTAAATVAIAVATIVYTHYAKKQWEVLSGQLREMAKQYPELKTTADVATQSADAFVAVQRAFLSHRIPAQGPFVMSIDGKKVLGMTLLLTWENSGSTPARRMVQENYWQEVPISEARKFDYRDLGRIEESPFVLGPKGLTTAPVTVTTSSLKAVAERRAYIYVWGWATYYDIFPRTPIRLTEYCDQIYYVAEKGEIGVAGTELSWATQGCKAHNCYDGDCPDYKERAKRAN